MSLRGLETATGIDRRTLSAIEKGGVDRMEAAKGRALAEALHVSIDAIAQGGAVATTATTREPDDEFRRYSPEEVAANKWLPWSARNIRAKVHARLIFAHTDGGRITFTADDIRRTNELGQVVPEQVRRRPVAA